MTTKKKNDDDEEVTLTKGKLRELIASAQADATMDDDERRIRSMVRDEVSSALGDFFSFDSDDDDDEDAGDKPKRTGGLASIFGIGS